MTICINCGEEVKDELEECPVCGAVMASSGVFWGSSDFNLWG